MNTHGIERHFTQIGARAKVQVDTQPQLRHLLLMSRQNDGKHKFLCGHEERHWVAQRRNPQVFVRGRIRPADHKTIVLPDWHQVLMNAETQSVAMRNVAFIDERRRAVGQRP